MAAAIAACKHNFAAGVEREIGHRACMPGRVRDVFSIWSAPPYFPLMSSVIGDRQLRERAPVVCALQMHIIVYNSAQVMSVVVSSARTISCHCFPMFAAAW
jgi:hypothetical protein